MIHPNEKPCLVQGKIRFPALALGLVFLFFPVSADTKSFQTELDFKLKSLVLHGSVLIADISIKFNTGSTPLPRRFRETSNLISGFSFAGSRGKKKN